MNEKPYDDLTKIQGIGEGWQRQLRELFGVHTFQDLANLSSDEIRSGLKPSPGKNRSDAWIRQAQEIAEKTKSSDLEIEEVDKQSNSLVDLPKWKPVASFVVEFLSRTIESDVEQRQTRVQHMETDTNASWPGIENTALCRWMLEQMGEPILPELEPQIEERRIQVQRELQEELEKQRVAAEHKLRQKLMREQTHARKVLEESLDTERDQMRKELEEEGVLARQTLQRELDGMRSQAQLEIKQVLEEDLSRARQTLQKELDQERTQARQTLEQELKEIRTQAHLELEKRLKAEGLQVQQDLDVDIIQTESEVLVEPSEQEPQAQPEPATGFSPTARTPEMLSAHESHAALGITRLQVFQPVNATKPIGVGIPDRPFSGILSSDEPFTVVVDFDLSETVKTKILQQHGMKYDAQFYRRDLATGAKNTLGSTEANEFVRGRTSYSAKLSNVTLESGFYELTILVTARNGYPLANYLMVPLLPVT